MIFFWLWYGNMLCVKWYPMLQSTTELRYLTLARTLKTKTVHIHGGQKSVVVKVFDSQLKGYGFESHCLQPTRRPCGNFLYPCVWKLCSELKCLLRDNNMLTAMKKESCDGWRHYEAGKEPHRSCWCCVCVSRRQEKGALWKGLAQRWKGYSRGPWGWMG